LTARLRADDIGRVKPDPRMQRKSLHARLLQRAAQLVGGRDKLAQYLEVRAIHLDAWMSGKSEMPSGIFLRVVDVVELKSNPPLAKAARFPPLTGGRNPKRYT
jgi:hypothetical protein